MKFKFIQDTDIISIYGGATPNNTFKATQTGGFLNASITQLGGTNEAGISQDGNPTAISAFAHVFQKGTANDATIDQAATHSVAKLKQILVVPHFY